LIEGDPSSSQSEDLPTGRRRLGPAAPEESDPPADPRRRGSSAYEVTLRGCHSRQVRTPRRARLNTSGGQRLCRVGAHRPTFGSLATPHRHHCPSGRPGVLHLRHMPAAGQDQQAGLRKCGCGSPGKPHVHQPVPSPPDDQGRCPDLTGGRCKGQPTGAQIPPHQAPQRADGRREHPRK